MEFNHPQPTLVVAAVMRRGDRTFIARRSPNQRLAGQWEFPGGKVNPGETPAAALRRELREELAIDAHIGPQLGTVDIPGERGTYRLLFFDVAPPDGPITLHDHDASAWATRAELDAYPLVAADREFLENGTSSG